MPDDRDGLGGGFRMVSESVMTASSAGTFLEDISHRSGPGEETRTAQLRLDLPAGLADKLKKAAEKRAMPVSDMVLAWIKKKVR